MGGKEKKENINSKERIISGNRAKNKRFEETGKLARACVPYGQEHTCVALRCTTCTRTADTQFHCRRYPLFARGSGEQLIGIFALVRSCGLHMARRFRNDTDVVFARARDKRKKRKKRKKKKKRIVWGRFDLVREGIGDAERGFAKRVAGEILRKIDYTFVPATKMQGSSRVESI